MKKLLIALGAGMLLTATSYVFAVQKFMTLDKISVNADAAVIRLSGKTKYHAFKISNPPRLVVEFTNTEYNCKEKEIAVKGAIIQRVRGGQFKDEPVKVARIVIDLSSMAEYEIAGRDKEVTVSFYPKKPVQTTAAVVPVPEKNAGVAPVPAAASFVKTGTVLAAAPDADKAKPKIENGSANAVKRPVAAEKKKVPPASSKTPVTQDAAPVKAATAPDNGALKEKSANQPVKTASVAVPANPHPADTKAPEVTVLTPIEPPADAKHIEKFNTETAVAVPAPKPVSAPAVEQPAPPALSTRVALPKKPVTLDFEEADIRDVLRILSMKSGINIIYGSDVAGTVSVRLENVPFDKAFETIMSLKNLVSQEQGPNILRVVTPQKISDERAQAVTFTKIFPLNYAKGDEVKANLDSIRNAEGRRGNVSVDVRTNSLIVTDTPEGLMSVEQIIGELDKKPQQVIIEAKIVELVLTDNLDLGIEWAYARTIPTANGVMTIGQSTPQTIDYKGTGKTTPVSMELRTANNPVSGGTGVSFPAVAVNGQMGAISFGLVEDSSRLTAMITALAQKGLSKLLSNPKVTTINNRPARILVGQKIPYTTTTVGVSGTTQQTNFLDVGIKLNVTPTINKDKKITLDVHPEVSLFIRADPAGPVIGTREAQTTVIVSNGETVVIGGLITEDERKLGTQVPLLGDLPIIGYLFKRQYNTKDRTELLVFLTPQIIE